MYRILNNRTAPNLKDLFARYNELQANYDLRSRCTDLALPNPKIEFLKNSFEYSGAKLWNSLPTEAKLAISENVFKLSLN